MNYYEILGVSRFASSREIKHAYIELCKKWHPDANPDPDATRMMQQINEAYDVLGNPSSRSTYDWLLIKRESQPQPQPTPTPRPQQTDHSHSRSGQKYRQSGRSYRQRKNDTEESKDYEEYDGPSEEAKETVNKFFRRCRIVIIAIAAIIGSYQVFSNRFSNSKDVTDDSTIEMTESKTTTYSINNSFTLAVPVELSLRGDILKKTIAGDTMTVRSDTAVFIGSGFGKDAASYGSCNMTVYRSIHSSLSPDFYDKTVKDVARKLGRTVEVEHFPQMLPHKPEMTTVESGATVAAYIFAPYSRDSKPTCCATVYFVQRDSEMVTIVINYRQGDHNAHHMTQIINSFQWKNGHPQ
ncbi:MAG: J domain-containing protein [Bacteroidales bacterium]|nr:J domain-containing protein [Bacteroidales bacterium]